jgi:hypothetical protein
MASGDPADSGTEMQRAMAERAREFAAGGPGYRPRPYWQSAIGLVLAALVVFLVFFGFDSFLGGMQRVIEIIVADQEAAEAVPVFIVPDSPGQP